MQGELLTIVTFLPLLAGLVLLATGIVARALGASGLPDSIWRASGFAASLATFLISIGLFTGFDPTETDYQFVQHIPWIADYGIHYYVGIDGISLLLVLLTTFLMPITLLASWHDIAKSLPSYVFFMLFLETGMLGAFVSLNLFQFYVFWELMLVPMYFIIGIWGGPRRVYAAVKFFLFTMVGSLLMLIAMLVIYSLFQQQTGTYTFDFVAPPGSQAPALLDTLIPVTGIWWQTQFWLFGAFALAFAIKVPMVPLHTWLPDAHVEAPTAGSVVLAGVLLKMGTYGFLRFALPLFPAAVPDWTPAVLVLSVIGIVYGSLVAMVQEDIKKLVAYSSVAHLGFVMLGMFALNVQGATGSVLQMINHGLSTGALFLLVGMLYERRHTRLVTAFGGVAKPMPVYAFFFGLVTMSSIGLPMLNGFVGEFLILLGAFLAHPWYAVVAASGVVLAAAYMLWMFRRVMFGPVDNPENRKLIDLDLREKVVLVAISIPIVWIGVNPDPLLRRIEPSVSALLQDMHARAAQAEAAPAPAALAAESAPVTPPVLNLSVLGPIAAVATGAMFVLIGEVLLSGRKSFLGRKLTESYIGSLLALISMLSLGIATYMAAHVAIEGVALPFEVRDPMFQLDPFSALVTAVLGLAALLSCALSMHYLDELRINHGEFYALILFATSGMMLLVAAVDMLPVFLGLELMSIPIYVLAGFDRRRLRSNESAMKYFLIGSFASAILLYGVALLYGVSGSTSFAGIRAGFDPENPLALAGLAFVVVGFAFKISSVPFHQWTPDVYEGAPSAVTAFMSVTVKLAAFAAFVRVLALSFEPLGDLLGNILWVLAAATVVVGNLMAVIQENIKRLLAYSSIAHAGYLLIGFVPGTAEGYSAVMFYLIAYLFMNLGAFGVVVALANRGQDCERMSSLAGLAQRRPGLAALMTLFMIALAGIPGTAGFTGKFLIFKSAVDAGEVPLAILGVLMSVVSVYYYLRVPVLMYMRDPSDEVPRLGLDSGEIAVLAVCAAGVLYLGLFPNGSLPGIGEVHVLDWARDSVEALFSGAPAAMR